MITRRPLTSIVLDSFWSNYYCIFNSFHRILRIFKTSRERVETFTSLRKDPTTLPLSLKEAYPQYYTLLQKMLSHNYNERPTAKELLDSHLFDTPQEETMQSLLEQNQVFSYSLF